jgi:hypothetical protein
MGGAVAAGQLYGRGPANQVSEWNFFADGRGRYRPGLRRAVTRFHWMRQLSSLHSRFLAAESRASVAVGDIHLQSTLPEPVVARRRHVWWDTLAAASYLDPD